MAQAAWNRPGSPIGKKGPRKVNPKYKRRAGEPWTTQEVRELRSLAKGNTPTGVISLKLQRPPAGIRSKAHSRSQRRGSKHPVPVRAFDHAKASNGLSALKKRDKHVHKMQTRWDDSG